MSRFGKKLIEAAKEARAIARGEADPATYRAHIPAEVDVRQIRRKLDLTQDAFSLRFGIPVATIKDWEQGRRAPEGAARVLLMVIDHEPKAVERALRKAAAAA